MIQHLHMLLYVCDITRSNRHTGKSDMAKSCHRHLADSVSIHGDRSASSAGLPVPSERCQCCRQRWSQFPEFCHQTTRTA